jgi:hypothetical protein
MSLIIVQRQHWYDGRPSTLVHGLSRGYVFIGPFEGLAATLEYIRTHDLADGTYECVRLYPPTSPDLKGA